VLSRRDLFAGAALAAAACSSKPSNAQTGAKITRAILISMLPKDLPYSEGFKMAVDLGYSEMEAQTVDDAAEAERIKDAADKAGLRIHSVMNMAHWGHPLSSLDPADVDASVEGMTASLRQAKLYGADTVLLVPALVQGDTTYGQAWERSQKVIRERILPVAEENDVIVAIEEVWNRFLLTARDFNQYIDEFDHPLVKAYFDVGNVVHYGVPQHWIREVGDRIVKLHLKEYSRKTGFVNLGDVEAGGGLVDEGVGVDWAEVRNALDDIGYEGAATVELKSGDRAYLDDLGKRVDRLLGLA